MIRPTGYNLSAHREMIIDRSRSDGYVLALERLIRPGCRVLDLGAGTGFFGLLACRLGATRVYCVEPEEIIEVARQFLVDNKFQDRVSLIQKTSDAVALPEKIDVIISDLRGVLPLFERHIPSIVDVRERLLAPGGILIPECDTLWVAIIEDAELYGAYVNPWLFNHYQLDMSAGHGLMVNTWRKVYAQAEQLIVSPQKWTILDYKSILSPNVTGELCWTAQRSGIAHGLIVWFDAELGGGIGFSNAPGQPQLIYGQAFFPFQEAVELAPGDRINVCLRASLLGDTYVWQWQTRVFSAGAKLSMKANFSQSTFHGAPIAMGTLKRREAGFVPMPSDNAVMTRFILTAMDGYSSLGEIAEQLRGHFPERFSREQEALTFVADVVARYSS